MRSVRSAQPGFHGLRMVGADQKDHLRCILDERPEKLDQSVRVEIAVDNHSTRFAFVGHGRDYRQFLLRARRKRDGCLSLRSITAAVNVGVHQSRLIALAFAAIAGYSSSSHFFTASGLCSYARLIGFCGVKRNASETQQSGPAAQAAWAERGPLLEPARHHRLVGARRRAGRQDRASWPREACRNYLSGRELASNLGPGPRSANRPRSRRSGVSFGEASCPRLGTPC